MRSIQGPKMFNTNSTNIGKATDYNMATKQNAKLLLQSEKTELFGDPYFGVLLKHYLFNQNDYVLRDAVIDVIYTQLALFIPQVKIKREDINVVQDREKGKVYVEFSGVSQIDYTVNTYNLTLLETSDF